MPYETKLLLDRALPLQRAGQWTAAIDLCRNAFFQSVQERDIDNLTEAVLRSGLCYRQLGERELAEEYLELAFAIATACDDHGRSGRALNGLAALHHLHGDMEEAERLYEMARAIAAEAGDARTLAYVDQNLGVLCAIRGDIPAAILHYESALRFHREIQNDHGAAGVLNNLGMLYTDLRDVDAADRCLSEALEVCRKVDDVVTEGLVHLNRTELFVLSGQLDRARSSCDEAFEIVSRLGEHATKVDVLRSYGMVYRETNKLYLAEAHLRDAIHIAATHQYPLEEAETQRELALVLRAQDRNREALEALNRAHELFSSLQAKQQQADIDQRLDQLQEDFITLVRAWGESIEAKDRYTRGHCQRVADYACRMAERAGIGEREMGWFRMGAFLHDVGKTEVPEEILNKPGRLTDEERAIIERHTVIGDEMLSPIEFPWDIRPMVRSHHERWDGRGYPDGLRGEAIPLTARILHIADVFDALTTTRSYREPLSPEQAFQIMESDCGSFDPDLFEIFRELFPQFKGIAGDGITSGMFTKESDTMAVTAA